MNIYHTIEELSFIKQHMNNNDLYEVIKLFPIQQWVRAGEYFLKGIPRESLMSEDIRDTMRGICYYYREHELLTNKQQIYLVGHLIANWQEISYEYRGYVVMC